MNRVMIIGFSGSGKSTLAQRLGKILKIEPVHLDAVAWSRGWVMRSAAEAEALVTPVLNRDRWIIEGNYSNILYQERLSLCDTLIFLDVPAWRCFFGVLKRYIRYKGVTRPDMADGCPEKVDFEFLTWVLWKGRKSRKKRLEAVRRIERDPGKRAYVFRNYTETENFLKETAYYQNRSK